MKILALAGAIALILWVMWDAFETILLPRRVPARARLSRWVIRWLWRLWASTARGIGKRSRRENLLSFYALLSILTLLVVWAGGLILGFALIYWADGSRLDADRATRGFGADLYLSGSTFFTLGLGDVRPVSVLSRLVTVIEAGTGFGFLALVLAYLPVLYAAFSKREARITMLDEWAGSPPTAAVLLRRCSEARDPNVIAPLLKDWELASAETLESHLSYPVLCYFRSQHDNQSWLASMVAILDTCALVIVGVEGIDPFQARLTFAIARHALVDLSQIFRSKAMSAPPDSRPVAELRELRAWLARSGVRLTEGDEADRRLADLRTLYLPYAYELSERLLMPLPPLLPPERLRYNWETTAWSRTARDGSH
ncbi:MAG TPA: potassium channel family protein [Candidatus Sulfotelmatobacter sp.]|nr:potassium channel family protein [Candidatus Sulfotelmatobacter sp.]